MCLDFDVWPNGLATGIQGTSGSVVVDEDI